ncbi:MAG: HAMP domain-containing histidine kinase [Planctomycetia bacterium]|nr:HAMP domain-containing histidine kinase [Planctomycetia bacterium]
MNESNRRDPLRPVLADLGSRVVTCDNPGQHSAAESAVNQTAAARAAGCMHNQLASTLLYLELLRRRLTEDRGSLDVVRKIAGNLTQLDHALSDLAQFVAPREPRCGSVSMTQLVGDVVSTVAVRCEAQGVRTEVYVPGRVSIYGDYDLLHCALRNLTLHALSAMPHGGQLVITVVAGSGSVEVEVADSGRGLPRERLRQAFEPFQTSPEGGSGLELAVAAQIVAAHGGKTIADNCPEGGTALTLQLPVATPLRAAA